ncbi:hypothetical protein N7535_006513 [Penicillium sp. DV-2018c]|nr:hypothetical protein N7535_006513 [Penicillium sp. DV-2018c]
MVTPDSARLSPTDKTGDFLRDFFRTLSPDGQTHLVDDIFGCANDEQLRQLVRSIDLGLLIPFKTQGGKTPTDTTPSPYSDDEDSIENLSSEDIEHGPLGAMMFTSSRIHSAIRGCHREGQIPSVPSNLSLWYVKRIPHHEITVTIFLLLADSSLSLAAVEYQTLVDYVYRLIRDWLVAHRLWASDNNLDSMLTYQLKLEFRHELKRCCRHACETEWVRENSCHCEGPICASESAYQVTAISHHSSRQHSRQHSRITRQDTERRGRYSDITWKRGDGKNRDHAQLAVDYDQEFDYTCSRTESSSTARRRWQTNFTVSASSTTFGRTQAS